ncbi:MAG: bifunctional adenosylcobinamide kinase/adenosylcobinamide-phosphate guanylyltransferase [Kineosporiaceae bacterium]
METGAGHGAAAGAPPTPDVGVVLGSAGEPWPLPGCGCVACRSGSPANAAALRVGAVTLLEGRIDTPEGPGRLRAGQRHEAGGVRIVALPGPGQERPLLVVGLGGGSGTVLWCAGAGDLPDDTLEVLTGAGLAGVALDVRGSDGRPQPRHLAHNLARLRAAGALAPGSDVVAIGLTHEVRPELLARRLAWWGARVAADGSPFPAPRTAARGTAPGGGTGRAPRSGPAPEPVRILVLGPASSGKSAVAEDLLAAQPRVLYAATGPPPDADGAGRGVGWAERVAAHRARRPPWWDTDETGDVSRLLAEPGPPLLLDALGTWVAAAMDRAGAWHDAPGWRSRVESEVDAVVAAWRQTRRRAVAVGEEVGWGVLPADAGIAAFREVAGDLAQRLAAESELVLLVVAGRVVELT